MFIGIIYLNEVCTIAETKLQLYLLYLQNTGGLI